MCGECWVKRLWEVDGNRVACMHSTDGNGGIGEIIVLAKHHRDRIATEQRRIASKDRFERHGHAHAIILRAVGKNGIGDDGNERGYIHGESSHGA